MPQCCSVPLCCSRNSGHRFPREKTLLKKWIIAIRREKFALTLNSRVCNKQFIPNDYVLPKDSVKSNPKLMLKKNAVPSIFSWTKIESEAEIKRRERSTKRLYSRQQLVVLDAPKPDCNDNVPLCTNLNTDTLEVEVDCSVKDFGMQCMLCDCNLDKPKNDPNIMSDNNPKLKTVRADFRIEYLTNKPEELQFYTGFQNYNHFMLVFNLLGDQVNNLKYYTTMQTAVHTRILNPKNEFFLTLVKLRRNMANKEIQFRFGISQTTAGNIFITWINFLFCQFKEINIWANRSIVEDNMKLKGELYSSTVVIACTEMKIVQPKNPISQQQTYSSYKSCNTVKVLIGISLTGSVTFISDAYGGSISDRELFEKCGIIDVLQDKDIILCDRGTNVQDLVSHKNVTVNMPEFMKKNATQFEPTQLRKSKQISSKRIHVERIIGLGKTYNILSSRFESTQVQLAGRIIFVCFMLTNFRRNIM